MTVEVDQRPPRRSRYIYPAFIASLALNLLFIGGFAAAAWHHRHDNRMKAREPGMLGFVEKLSPDRQQPVRAEIVAAREALKDLKETVRKTWAETNDQLAVEPFDEAKFKEALSRLRDVENQYRTALNNALAETAAKFTPEERKLLKNWRENRRARFLRHNKDRTNGKKAD